MKAKDIMTRDVITVRPTTTVEDIAHLLTKHRIGVSQWWTTNDVL